MATFVYDSFLDDILNNVIVNPSGATYKCMLVTSSYTPNQGTHTRFTDVTNEVVGAGYSSGGATVTMTVVKDTATHKNKLVFSLPSWASATITARGAVFYISTGTPANDPLVGFSDFTTDKISTNGTFAITAWANDMHWQN